jgi:serine protease Do
VRITGSDLNVFDFDYDLTWAAFFMNADEKIYGRYGGRDAKGADTRNSLPGLKYAMRAALEAHGREPKDHGAADKQPPVYVENLPPAINHRGCIHCHQVKEIRRQDALAKGLWKREEVWVYPLPENVGITLEIDRGNVVRSVAPSSAADQAGVRTGDLIQRMSGFSVNSFADAQYALHHSPAKGRIPINWLRVGKTMAADLAVADGWRKTNITWRPSLLDLLPSLTLFGPDLTAKEKKVLGLDAKQLAFRQDKNVHSDARAMGIQGDDIVIGIDNERLEMTVTDFLAHVRRNYLVGDRAILKLIRNGQRIDLQIKLR